MLVNNNRVEQQNDKIDLCNDLVAGGLLVYTAAGGVLLTVPKRISKVRLPVEVFAELLNMLSQSCIPLFDRRELLVRCEPLMIFNVHTDLIGGDHCPLTDPQHLDQVLRFLQILLAGRGRVGLSVERKKWH